MRSFGQRPRSTQTASARRYAKETFIVKVTYRDTDILKAVYTFGFLTSLQVSTLFEMHLKVCQKRLRILVKAGYLKTVPLPTVNAGRSPNLFYLGRQAEAMLDVRSACPRMERKTSHAMKNADILIQAALDCKAQEVECSLLPEHTIRVAGLEVIPDGAFMLKRGERRALFLLENCAGTEALKSQAFYHDIETKIIRYREIFEKNHVGFYENFFETELRRFRLLYIANNFTRLEAIIKLASEHDIHGFIWLTKLAELKKGVLADIWSVPAAEEINVSIIGQ